MKKNDAKQLLSPVLSCYHNLDISHGEGLYLVDTQNQRYLDFGSGIAVTSTGHCHPEVVSAIQHQAETLIHPCIAMGHYPSLLECATALTDLLPHASYSVFFDQSGTGAVEAAIKLAKFTSKRKKIVAFQGGFHGRSIGSLSLTTSKQHYREGYESFLIDDVDFFPYPYCYRCPWDADASTCQAKACSTALINSPLFDDDVAAVIIEPVLGEAGYVPAPLPFLKALQDVCTEKGILLILDEIQTGIGRTGKWFSFQHTDISPDIIVTAKGLGSGMPISACLAKAELMNQWPKGSHGGTYGGNPVTCAAATATINVVSSHLDAIPTLSNIAEDFLTQRLSDHPYIGDIRVTGLMIGIECVEDKQTKQPHPTLCVDIMTHCLTKHLIVLMCGLHGNVLRIAPPLIISESELINGLTLLCEVIDDYR